MMRGGCVIYMRPSSNLDAFIKSVREKSRHSLLHDLPVLRNRVEQIIPKMYTDKIHVYSSVDVFLSQTCFSNGIHKIYLEPNIYLDILIYRNPFTIPSYSRIPVFFSGAVTSPRNSPPPYFSGRALSKKIRQGIIAISDPLFYCDDDITVGWYTGIPEWTLQSTVTQILERIIHVSERQILCVGGSAGGFAALEAAAHIKDSAAFVWNAQTSILEYGGFHIRPWMNLLFNEDWDQGGHWRVKAEELLASTQIIHDVTKLPLPENLLYMQNDTDWHVKKHFLPYVEAHDMERVDERLYQKTERHVACLAHFGEGHAVPARDVIVRGIRGMIRTDVCSYDVYDNFVRSQHR